MSARAPDPTSLSDRARLFQALSDETRLAILDLLRSGEWCVCDLQAELDAAQSRLSFHLKVLREAGLVQDRKEGRWSYYTLVPHRLEAAAEAAATFARPAARRATAAAARLYQLTRDRGPASGARVARLRAPRTGAAGECCE